MQPAVALESAMWLFRPSSLLVRPSDGGDALGFLPGREAVPLHPGSPPNFVMVRWRVEQGHHAAPLRGAVEGALEVLVDPTPTMP